MHLLALPHIIASDPSALKMCIEKSACDVSEGFPMSTKPSLAMPKWGRLHAMAAFSGCGMTSLSVLT